MRSDSKRFNRSLEFSIDMAQDSNLPPGCTNADIDRHMGASLEDCPDCEGDGKVNQSDCCGAEILGEDICSDCKEHCEKAKCEECDGTGKIDVEARKAAAKEEARIERYESRRDEERDSE